VRELVRELRAPRDREVLERLYLREESRDAICKSLNLTNKQLAQVLWRAHQRFRAILSKNGVSSEFSHARNKRNGNSQSWISNQSTSDIKRK
jgi:hypothetical protein